MILPQIIRSKGKYAIAVAGESGSGKSTITQALAHGFEKLGISCIVLQQDDYYVYPPKTNDRVRRNDRTWNGVREVHIDLLDQHINDFLNGTPELQKPLIIYDNDCIDTEILPIKDVNVMIVEGGYVTILHNVNTRLFIERTYLDTRTDRERRARYAAELDDFTENILKIEHDIISKHKARADILITKDYKVIQRRSLEEE
jgi:uridine kinase